MNKKGYIVDYLLFIVMFFIVVIGAIVIWFVMSKINDSISSNNVIPSDIKTKYDNSTAKLNRTFDYTIITIFILVSIALISISYVIPTNPILFFVLLIVSILGIILAGYLGNVFFDLSNSAVLGDAISNFPITIFLMNNYLIMSLFLGVLMSIAYFAKPSDVG
jgi:hypothetical protein